MGLALLLAGWLGVVAVGLGWLEAYHARPGDAGSAWSWPGDCPIARDPNRPTLVLFVHPLCPCSRASVRELAALRADQRDQFAPVVVVWEPREPSAEWRQAARVLDDAALPGWSRWVDRGGELSRRFGVRTSGHVLIFDPRGKLLWSGGVTPSRGQQAEPGRLEALLAGLVDGTSLARRGPVFGCSMGGPEPLVQEGMP